MAKGRTIEPPPWEAKRPGGGKRIHDDVSSWEAKRAAAGPPVRNREEVWIDEGDVRDRARGAVQRGSARPKTTVREEAKPRERKPPAHLVNELEPIVGPSHAPKLGERLAEAGRAFRRERYTEARQVLVPLAERAPASPAVRELLGLTNYRLGRWKDAIKELDAFRSLTGSADQHPVLADCYRALKHYDEVDALWTELRGLSPSSELVSEGRIVAAGALADQGQIRDAIALLEPAVKRPKKLAEHHLRMLYALADLYERAGDVPKARQLFKRLAAADADFADVRARLRALR